MVASCRYRVPWRDERLKKLRAEAMGCPEPFLKWAGSKRSLAEEVAKELGELKGIYHEPFLGGGAVFFYLHKIGALKTAAALADINAILVRTYHGVRDDAEEVIKSLRGFKNDEKTFLHMRESDPSLMSRNGDVASWMIYLNKTCFNGLYRVNLKGRFNVPFGRYESPKICDATLLRACSRALMGADVSCQGFVGSLERVERGDAVYLDPPYIPASKTADFTRYTREGFGMGQQEQLEHEAARAGKRGARVVLSNSDTPVVRELYRARAWQLREVSVRGTMAADASKRGARREVLITWRG